MRDLGGHCPATVPFMLGSRDPACNIKSAACNPTGSLTTFEHSCQTKMQETRGRTHELCSELRPVSFYNVWYIDMSPPVSPGIALTSSPLFFTRMRVKRGRPKTYDGLDPFASCA